MSRRKEIRAERKIAPDSKFSNIELSKFINVIMKSGKKSVAEKIVYSALEEIFTKSKKDPMEVFTAAVNNVKPMVEVRSRRIGGATYQVPVEVRPNRRIILSMRWIKDAARKRTEKSMISRLSHEIMEAYNKHGGAFKKKEEVHRMAESNRAFSHFRF